MIHIMTFLRSPSKEFEMQENKSYQEKISYIEKLPKRVPIQRLPKGRQSISQIYTNGLGLQKSKKICFVSTPCTFFHYNVSANRIFNFRLIRKIPGVGIEIWKSQKIPGGKSRKFKNLIPGFGNFRNSWILIPAIFMKRHLCLWTRFFHNLF